MVVYLFWDKEEPCKCYSRQTETWNFSLICSPKMFVWAETFHRYMEEFLIFC